jgi:hypothetical protein
MTNKLVDRLREPNRKQLPDWPEDLLTEAADAIERLTKDVLPVVEKWAAFARESHESGVSNMYADFVAEIERLQARVDSLMLEYCPSEMTDAQREEWAKHQRPSSEPNEQRPADGTRDGDGVWQGGFWHPDAPGKCSCKFESTPTTMSVTTDRNCPQHGGLLINLYTARPVEGASRDAAESWRTALQDVSPPDLVGALQDVVHTDPGPVRAGKAHRDASHRVGVIDDAPYNLLAGFWECECEAPDNFRHESTEWCADCGTNRPTVRTGE